MNNTQVTLNNHNSVNRHNKNFKICTGSFLIDDLLMYIYITNEYDVPSEKNIDLFINTFCDYLIEGKFIVPNRECMDNIWIDVYKDTVRRGIDTKAFNFGWYFYKQLSIDAKKQTKNNYTTLELYKDYLRSYIQNFDYVFLELQFRKEILTYNTNLKERMLCEKAKVKYRNIIRLPDKEVLIYVGKHKAKIITETQQVNCEGTLYDSFLDFMNRRQVTAKDLRYSGFIYNKHSYHIRKLFKNKRDYNTYDMLEAYRIYKFGASEILTPRKIVEDIISLLPEDLFKPDKKFLDPVCKSARFLIAIKDRLMESPWMIVAFPNKIDRLKHILSEQLYGIALSESSQIICTRVLYGELINNSNIRYMPEYYKNLASKNIGKAKELIQREFNIMTFDAVVSNPPYQENTGGGLNENGATALFDQFIKIGIELAQLVCMITPTKWISGTQSNMKNIREALRKDNHIKYIVDFMNSKDCFPNNSIAGGVNYFLYDKQYTGDTYFTTVLGKPYTKNRNLNMYDIIPRHAIADSIIKKIQDSGDRIIADNIVKNRWGLPTNYNEGSKSRLRDDDIKIITPNSEYYIPVKSSRLEGLEKYKVKFTRVITEHAVEPSKLNNYTLLSSLSVLKPYEICNASYMILGDFKEEEYAINGMNYLKTKFVRFLLLQTLFGIGLTSEKFMFIPTQDFTKEWTDQMLYEKYNLTQEEVDYIESTIKSMK